MKTADQVDKIQLKEMVGLLNQLPGVLPKKIKVVAVSHENLFTTFVTAVKDLPKELDDRFEKRDGSEDGVTVEDGAKWDKVIDFYNGIMQADAPTKAGKTPKAKKEKAPKDPKAKKEKSSTGRGETWGGTVKKLLLESNGKTSNEDIAKEVTKRFPDTREILPKDVNFYRSKLKKTGELSA